MEKGDFMSDRWDFIEKEMDENFVRKLIHDKEVFDAYCKYQDLLFHVGKNNPSQYTNDALEDVRLRDKIRLHKLKKELRRIWFNIFKC